MIPKPLGRWVATTFSRTVGGRQRTSGGGWRARRAERGRSVVLVGRLGRSSAMRGCGRVAACTSSGSTSLGATSSPPGSRSSTTTHDCCTWSAVHTDDEIAVGLAAYVDGDCLAAIDAPIVVTNAKGSRPAEQQLSKDFRRYDAATHPSNTGKPEFANGTRGRASRQATRPRHRSPVSVGRVGRSRSTRTRRRSCCSDCRKSCATRPGQVETSTFSRFRAAEG